MAEDTLTAAEIEVLIGRHSAASPTGNPQTRDASAADEKLIALLSRTNEVAARAFSGELAALVRRTVHVRPGSIEFVSAAAAKLLLESAPYRRRVLVDRLSAHWSLVFSASSLYPLIDCLLGGSGKTSVQVRRAPTEIESRLADRVLEKMLLSLEAAWRPTAPFEFALDAPRNGSSTRPTGNETFAYAWCTFSIELAGTQGELALAIPANLLSDPAMVDTSKPVRGAVEEVPTVEIVACLAETTITVAEVADLSLGDIIATDHRADRPIHLLHQGRPVFQARLGSWHGHKALEIEQQVSPSECDRETDAADVPSADCPDEQS